MGCFSPDGNAQVVNIFDNKVIPATEDIAKECGEELPHEDH